MLLEIAFLLSIVVNVGLAYMVNAGQKREEHYERTLVLIATAIDNIYREIRRVDYQGWFENDDEVGHIFRNIKELVGIMYTIVIVEDEDEQGGFIDDGQTGEEDQEEQELLY